MDEDQIRIVLGHHPVTKPFFKGVLAADECPPQIAPESLYIFNYSNRNEIGTHWCTLFVSYKGIVSFVDPLGIPPVIPGFEEALKNYKYVFFSKEVIQAKNTRSCGLFCILFGIELCRGKSIYEIRNSFDLKNLELNEEILKSRFMKEFKNVA